MSHRVFPVSLEPNELHMLLFIKVTILVTNICSVDHHVNLNIGTSKREFCTILLSLCFYQWTNGRLVD